MNIEKIKGTLQQKTTGAKLNLKFVTCKNVKEKNLVRLDQIDLTLQTINTNHLFSINFKDLLDLKNRLEALVFIIRNDDDRLETIELFERFSPVFNQIHVSLAKANRFDSANFSAVFYAVLPIVVELCETFEDSFLSNAKKKSADLHRNEKFNHFLNSASSFVITEETEELIHLLKSKKNLFSSI